MANAVLLPHVLEAYGEAAHEKLAELAIAAGLVSRAESAKDGAEAMIHAIQEMKLRLDIPDVIPEIQEKDIRYNEERSRLLRVLGSPWEKDAIEFEKEMDLKNIQAFLLCSDGFWELIDEEKMRETLNRAKTPQEWLEKMTKIVEKNGKGKEMDNYTAAAVFVTKAHPWWKFRKKCKNDKGNTKRNFTA